jgi:ADP-dependent NAD(P)H-hydrate dehydratase
MSSTRTPAAIARRMTRLVPRRRESHKGDYGRALLVGGSRGMSGAIALAGMGAVRGGAGLVTLAVPDPILDTVAALEPSYMTVPLPADREGRMGAAAHAKIAAVAREADCLACGPGLGRGDQAIDVVAWMYTSLPQPIVFDADALYALSHRGELLERPGGPRVLTPHPGEFRRLVDRDDLAPEDADEAAVELAARCNIVVVLKGHRTLVTDGRATTRNTTGNPGMATGGSGDVLTGLITALVCQKLPPREAAELGVYLHGLAGDLAAAELGEVCLIASDLVRFLPGAFQQAAATASRGGASAAKTRKTTRRARP